MLKRKWLLILITFGMTFIFHFGYTIFPNNISAIIFPVNESIWEHMKLLYTSFLITQLIYYGIVNRNKKDFNIIRIVLLAIISIPLYLLLYLPLYQLLGDNFIIAIGLILVIAVIIYLYIEPILNKYLIYNPELNVLGVLALILFYLILGYLTFYPPHLPLFFDYSKKIYGLK